MRCSPPRWPREPRAVPRPWLALLLELVLHRAHPGHCPGNLGGASARSQVPNVAGEGYHAGIDPHVDRGVLQPGVLLDPALDRLLDVLVLGVHGLPLARRDDLEIIP